MQQLLTFIHVVLRTVRRGQDQEEIRETREITTTKEYP